MNAYDLEVGQLVKIVRLDGKAWNGPIFRITGIGEVDGLKRWGPRVRGVVEVPCELPVRKGSFVNTHACDLDLWFPPSS